MGRNELSGDPDLTLPLVHLSTGDLAKRSFTIKQLMLTL